MKLRNIFLAIFMFIPLFIHSIELDLGKINFIKGFIAVEFGMKGKVPYKILSAIDDGIKISFIYNWRLKRKIAFFLATDPEIASGKIMSIVNWNFIEGVYFLRHSRKGQIFRFSNLVEIIDHLKKKRQFKILSKKIMEKNETYYLELKLDVKSIKLYPPFSFLSVFSVDSDWVRSSELKND